MRKNHIWLPVQPTFSPALPSLSVRLSPSRSWSLPLGNVCSTESLRCTSEGNNDQVTPNGTAFERRSKGFWDSGSPCWRLLGLPKCSRESRWLEKRSQDWVIVSLDLPLPARLLFPHQSSENYRAGYLTHQAVIKMSDTPRSCSFCSVTERHPQR